MRTVCENLPSEWALREACEHLDYGAPDEGETYSHYIAGMTLDGYWKVIGHAAPADKLRAASKWQSLPDPPETDPRIHTEAGCPSGCAIIERIGWEDDGRFTATLHFPSGPPDIRASVVWRKIPVRLVVIEESDNA